MELAFPWAHSSASTLSAVPRCVVFSTTLLIVIQKTPMNKVLFVVCSGNMVGDVRWNVHANNHFDVDHI